MKDIGDPKYFKQINFWYGFWKNIWDLHIMLIRRNYLLR